MKYYLVTLFWAGLIFAGSAIPQANLPQSASDWSLLAHLFEYAVLGFLAGKSFDQWRKGKELRQEREAQKATKKHQVMIYNLLNNKKLGIIFSLGFLYALSDEWHQTFVPGRSFEVIDLVVDSIGLVIGTLISGYKE